MSPSTATVQMQEVESSNIAAAGYNADTKQLYVKFQSGAQGRYSDVPEDIWAGWQSTFNDADVSSGSYFHKNIRNSFDYEAV